MPRISTIALACAGSAAAAVVARWIPKAPVPALVFEIAFGIALGPSGLALLAPGPTMGMPPLLGVAGLMLGAGLTSAGRPVGQQCVRTCRASWVPYRYKKNSTTGYAQNNQ